MVHTLRRTVRWLVFILVLLFGANLFMAHFFPMPYGEEVSEAAAENGVDKALLYAVMKAESNFDVFAESNKGAKGIMQMLPETARWCAEKKGQEMPDLSVPSESITIGAYYLSFLLNRYGGDEKVAVAAYNAGHGRVDTWLSDKAYSKDGKTLSKIPFSETEKYVKKVMLYKKMYEIRIRQYKKRLFGVFQTASFYFVSRKA